MRFLCEKPCHTSQRQPISANACTWNEPAVVGNETQASELAAKEGEVVYAVPEDLTESRMKEGSVGKP